MAKKRGGIADGVKAVYHIHQAFEAAQGLTATKVRLFIEWLGEMAMLIAALAVVYGIFWLLK